MSVFRTWSQIAENSGQQTYDLVDDFATATKNFTCKLWNQFPDKMAGKAGFVGKFTQGYMNRACQDDAPPAPPTPPFIGGQCCDKTYNVTYTWAFRRCYNNQQLTAGTETVSITGKITGIDMRQSGTTNPLTSVIIDYEDCDGNKLSQGVKSTTAPLSDIDCFTGNPFDPKASWISKTASTFTIDSIATADGSPDDCGSPGGSYPVSPPATEDDVRTEINIEIGGGVTNTYDLNLKIINNDIDSSLEMPINFDLGGIDLQVDMGGITFNNNFSNNNFNTGGQDLPSGENHPLPLPVSDTPTELEEEPLDPEQYTEVKTTSGQSGILSTEDKISYCTIELVQIPSNAKSQWGVDAPDVYYAGWYEFRSGNNNYNRYPVHFEKNIFYPPIGATSFAFTLGTGYIGITRMYTIKEQK